MGHTKKMKTRKPSKADAALVEKVLKEANWLKPGEAAVAVTGSDGVTRWERVKFEWRKLTPGKRPPRKAS